MRQQQHGDVLIHRVETLPSDAKRIKPVNGRLVLAEGEATGHAHTIVATKGVELYEIGGGMYLKVDGDAVTITHEEHNPQVIEPGIYEIGRVIEVDPFEQEIRRVAD